MPESQRSMKIQELIDATASDLADLAKWPESEGCRVEVEKTLKMLRKTFREDSYPQCFRVLAMVHLASMMYAGTTHRRDIDVPGLKEAWVKIAELLD